MKFLCWILLGFTLGAQAASAPQQNLWVEFRWTQSTLSPAALGGVRDGALVVGTAGSVSPQAGVIASTRPADEGVAEVPQRLLVLNGQLARVQWTEQQTLQWVDAAVDLPLDGARAGSSTRVIAAPRTASLQTAHGFAIRPQWPGGRQPVRVEFEALGATALLSTVSLPLDQWVTVARSGAAVRAPTPGVVSSRDAQGVPGRDLQLRVSIAP
jgi:hypothetical protein